MYRILTVVTYICCAFIVACKKTDSAKNKPKPVSFIDTAVILTSHSWLLVDVWNDNNNNNNIDSSEIFHQSGILDIYRLYSNGELFDTIPPHFSRYGKWTFANSTKSIFRMNWSTTDTPRFKIMAVTDSSMMWMKQGINQGWFMKRY